MSEIRDMPASLLARFERALGVDGAYRFFCDLSQEQIDMLVRVAIANEWITFTGDWHASECPNDPDQS